MDVSDFEMVCIFFENERNQETGESGADGAENLYQQSCCGAVLFNPYFIPFLFPLTAEILSIRQSRYDFFIIPIH